MNMLSQVAGKGLTCVNELTEPQVRNQGQGMVWLLLFRSPGWRYNWRIQLQNFFYKGWPMGVGGMEGGLSGDGEGVTEESGEGIKTEDENALGETAKQQLYL